jgi:nicotinamidase-related amidase
MSTALMLIDVQKGIDDTDHWGGNRNNPSAEENIGLLLNQWRSSNLPVIHIQHQSISLNSPFHPDKPGSELKDFIEPVIGEPTFRKSTANAFVGTFLQRYLAQHKITSLVLTGFVTNNSVEATARMAGDLGLKTTVVSDACACFDKKGLDGTHYASSLVHDLSLANLKGQYAEIRSTREILNLHYA